MTPMPNDELILKICPKIQHWKIFFPNNPYRPPFLCSEISSTWQLNSVYPRREIPYDSRFNDIYYYTFNEWIQQELINEVVDKFGYCTRPMVVQHSFERGDVLLGLEYDGDPSPKVYDPTKELNISFTSVPHEYLRYMQHHGNHPSQTWTLEEIATSNKEYEAWTKDMNLKTNMVAA